MNLDMGNQNSGRFNQSTFLILLTPSPTMTQLCLLIPLVCSLAIPLGNSVWCPFLLYDRNCTYPTVSNLFNMPNPKRRQSQQTPISQSHPFYTHGSFSPCLIQQYAQIYRICTSRWYIHDIKPLSSSLTQFYIYNLQIQLVVFTK